MNDEKQNPYPPPLLPEVNYQQFDEDLEPLVDLEYGVLENLIDFLKKLEHVLLNAKMIQLPELIVAHLCCYLGSVTSVYKAEKGKHLASAIINLLKHHANFAFSKFNEYPVNSSVSTQHEKQANLGQLREDGPGSIVAQTIRLGRIIIDMMERLSTHQNVSLSVSRQKQKEQKELFCPQNEFFAFLIPLVNEQHQEWQRILCGKSINHAINQLTLQIAWLIGYFAHLDKQLPNEGQYLEYGLPCITLYLDYTNEFLQAMRSKGQVLTSMQVASDDEGSSIDPKLESLFHEIHELSKKTHASLSLATTKFQKQTAIIQAGLEKLLIELMMENMAIKVLLMSLFYFWFTLDAPLRVAEPALLDDYSPFDEMENIIHLVKATTLALPYPELSSELKLLNAKMQSLKSYFSDPASFDEVPQDQIAQQSDRVNTAIHTLTSSYLKQGYHPEIIANVLFSQWLRLSVFYGVSESDWQKMDHYFVEILTAVRQYITTLTSSHS